MKPVFYLTFYLISVCILISLAVFNNFFPRRSSKKNLKWLEISSMFPTKLNALFVTKLIGFVSQACFTHFLLPKFVYLLDNILLELWAIVWKRLLHTLAYIIYGLQSESIICGTWQVVILAIQIRRFLFHFLDPNYHSISFYFFEKKLNTIITIQEFWDRNSILFAHLLCGAGLENRLAL